MSSKNTTVCGLIIKSYIYPSKIKNYEWLGGKKPVRLVLGQNSGKYLMVCSENMNILLLGRWKKFLER